MTMPWRRALAAAALALAPIVGGVLLAGTAQAQPVTTGTVTLSGDSNDPVTHGKSYSYSTTKGGVTLEVDSVDGSKVRIYVRLPPPGGGGWMLDFGIPDQPAPGQPTVLVPGTYTVPLTYSRTSPTMDVSGGSGCGFGTSGSFTVKKAIFGRQAYGEFYVQAFDATFVQHCDGFAAVARGEVNISNPPPSPPPPPPPSPSPSPTTPSPYAVATTYAAPTFEHPAAGGDAAHLARGGGAAGTSTTSTPWTQADRARFMAIGLGVIALVILVANVVIALRSRRLRQAYRAREPSPAWPATAVGAEHRWLQYDPSPPVARRSMPGKVIAVSVVLAVRGMLGLLLTFATIGALQLQAVRELGLPSWYTNVLWLQLAICAGEVVFGLLLLLGKEWPRMLSLSVLWFDIAAAILIMFATSFSCAGLFGIAVDAVLVWMLFWNEVTDWCY
jgi:hypothetical protein